MFKMLRILQSLLALISLLLLAWLAARANAATFQDPDDPAWKSVPVEPAACPRPRLLTVPRCLTPPPQPGTHFQGQPFAYGYFGAKAQPAAAFHRKWNGDWFQWTIGRAD
jgi:hypothetical protein